MADTQEALTTLSHINVPPAQTWNYLKIDETSLTVPAAKATGDVYARLPRLFDALECGIGEEAVSWIEDAAKDATYIEVPAHHKREEPIVCVVDGDKGEVADTSIMVRHHAEATIVVVSRGEKADAATSANLVRVVAEHDAQVHIIEIMALPEEHQHLEGIGIRAARNAVVDVRQYALGGAKVAAGLAADLAEDNARFDLVSRYLVRGHEELDLTHTVRQRGCSTRCDMNASGLLADAAKKTLRETIDLVHGGKGSKGNELETVLVEGDDIVNKTLPVILCDEEDVQGNHGASIGSISPEQEMYLAARGLGEDGVSELFAQAIFDDALIHAPEAQSKAALGTRMKAVLGEDALADALAGLALDKEDR